MSLTVMSARRSIHLVNPLWNAAGGSEHRTLELYRELAPHANVFLWTEHRPDLDCASGHPIRRIDLAGGCFPRGGTLVFVGIYQMPGPWIAKAKPRRAIVLYNTLDPRQLIQFMRELFAVQVERVEVVYASQSLKQQTKLRGVVEPSLIDLTRFIPRPNPVAPPDRFVAGRLSREDPRKHHPEDLPLYRQLAAAGCQVRVMGGTCLAKQGPLSAGVELLQVKSEPAEAFLHSLDCFIYRTAESWWETFGRVVHEAMACGLPVVCHRRGGYATDIQHGLTGFLFETTDEALAIIQQLREQPALRAKIGAAARTAMEVLYSPAERAKIVEYYLL